MSIIIYYEVFLLVFCGVIALIVFNDKGNKKSIKH